MPQKTLEITAPDGRTVEITGERMPTGAEMQNIFAKLPPATAAPSSQLETPGPSTLRRVATGAGNAIVEGAKGLATLSGIPGFLREGPVGAIKDQAGIVGGLLQSQFDQYQKAKAAEREGRTSEMIGHAVAAAVPGVGPMAARWGEMVSGGEGPEAVGEMAVGALTPFAAKAVPKTIAGAKAQFAERAAGKAAKSSAAVQGDAMMAVPPTKSAPYTVEDFQAAKPYLNAQHKNAPITSATGFRDALDSAVGEIEGRISGYIDAYPTSQVTPNLEQAIKSAFADNPRGDAMAIGLRELSDLPLGKPLTLKQADTIRRRMNAENQSARKRMEYDETDARFVAREAVARSLRDAVYDHLETRGVSGVRRLRRDEGALLKIRKAADRQEFAGHRTVSGDEPSLARKVTAGVAQAASTAAGAAMAGPVGAVGGAVVGNEIGAAIKGRRLTRDEMIARAFSVADDRLPSFPDVPVVPIRGALPPAPIAGSPVPDTSFVRGVPAEPARRIIRGELPPGRVVREGQPVPDTSGPIPPTGIRRRDFRSPVTMPTPGDMPDVFARLFGESSDMRPSARSLEASSVELPEVVYHGTTAKGFDTFQVGHAKGWGDGIYFTDNATQAADEFGHGGRVIKAKVDIKNPYRGQGLSDKEMSETKAWADIKDEWASPYDAFQEDSVFVGKVLRELGYDGIIADSNGINGKEIVAFRPNQVTIIREGSK